MFGFLLILLYVAKLFLIKIDQCCYMLHYECHKPTEFQRLDTKSCEKIISRNKGLGLEEYRFLLRTMLKSGLREGTYGPRSIIQGGGEASSLVDALSEMDDIMFSTLDRLFAKTGISPSEIDILVTTISLLSPAPSLAARVISRYKMRENIKAFNLSGMGCGASVVAVDLVQKLFESYNKSFAIIVSSESIGPNWYCGKDKSMLLYNVLFRSGGCSILLTNHRASRHCAILKLTSIVRTHLGCSDEAYESVLQTEDELGHRGIHLSKSLPKVASKALATNLRVLLPRVLPSQEILRYTILSYYNGIKLGTFQNPEAAGILDINLKSGIDHFCLHPGSRAIIEGVGTNLGLSEYDLEPTRMALHRFGNTSVGGLWYVLGYMEAKKRLKKGDKLLMISLGSGFKCNNCVCEVMRDMEDGNVWKEDIDDYLLSNTLNPFAEWFNWINDESLDSERFEANLESRNTHTHILKFLSNHHT